MKIKLFICLSLFLTIDSVYRQNLSSAPFGPQKFEPSMQPIYPGRQYLSNYDTSKIPLPAQFQPKPFYNPYSPANSPR
jgi:hypothetical protein